MKNDATMINQASWKHHVQIAFAISMQVLMTVLFYQQWNEMTRAETRNLATLEKNLQYPTLVNGTSLRKASPPFLGPGAKDLIDGTMVPHKSPTSAREQATRQSSPGGNSQPQHTNLVQNRVASMPQTKGGKSIADDKPQVPKLKDMDAESVISPTVVGDLENNASSLEQN